MINLNQSVKQEHSPAMSSPAAQTDKTWTGALEKLRKKDLEEIADAMGIPVSGPQSRPARRRGAEAMVVGGGSAELTVGGLFGMWAFSTFQRYGPSMTWLTTCVMCCTTN